MNQGRKIKWLFTPLIVMIFIHIPILVNEIAYKCMNISILESSGMLKNFGLTMFIISMVIWCFSFYYIPTIVYILMVLLYTFFSWKWVVTQKKSNAFFFILWIILSIVSIILYWKFKPEYFSILNGQCTLQSKKIFHIMKLQIGILIQTIACVTLKS